MFFLPRRNILVFLPILAENIIAFFFKKKEFVLMILFCALVHLFSSWCILYVLFIQVIY